MPGIAAILLAAGNASRMGSPKQLMEFGGKPLLRRAAETALASQCSLVIAVLGAHASAVGQALKELPVTIVENDQWAEGMGTSIQAGLRAAVKAGADAVILTLADQPLVLAEFLDRLIDIHRESGRPIVAARYAGTVGVPVLFSKEYFSKLTALRPAQGCKGVILADPGNAFLVDCPEAEFDVDTPQDFLRLKALQEG
ncbi:nucleotidyltransferase family protein [Paludibaculum fermentans]|uniref:nucleotidyltransferase family protein n=1 Tax=Paludibaculum fermentans TaxID=1473598 RepID=UPI003EBFD9BC